jgi:UDP-glucuronate decarboxylase
MKKILITGGAGFLGSHLARTLLADGNEVVVMDNLFTGNKSNMYAFEKDPRFTFILQDVTQPFWGQFDEIYNLACPASPVHYQRNPVETIRTSLMGMMHVLDLALRTKARVLHASTSEVYGDPLEHPQKESYWGHVNVLGIRSCYDEGKRCAETLCADYHRQYGVDVRLIRIFNTYGPHMHPQDGRVISNFIVQALANKDITIYGSGEQTRSFQYVDDLIRGMQAYMARDAAELQAWFTKKGYAIPVLNVGNPGEFTIKELAEKVLRGIPDSRSKLVYQPLPCDDPRQRQPDITFAGELLGWEPKVPLDEGLKRTIAWFRAQQKPG